jgi:hypothetical protein
MKHFISSFGIHYTKQPNHREVDPEQVKACLEFLKNCAKSKTINSKRSSYTVKHICERIAGIYISNGAAISALIALDFTMKIEPPNAYFNLSNAELKKLEQSVNNRE